MTPTRIVKLLWFVAIILFCAAIAGSFAGLWWIWTVAVILLLVDFIASMAIVTWHWWFGS